MAYESRIIVVSKFNTKGYDEEVKDFYACEELARINLCRIDDEVLGRIKSYPASDCYIWDQGKPRAKDYYGDLMTEIPLKDAIKIFAYATSISDYRRYEPCLSLLKGFDTAGWEDSVVVLHFGY